MKILVKTLGQAVLEPSAQVDASTLLRGDRARLRGDRGSGDLGSAQGRSSTLIKRRGLPTRLNFYVS
jgi:hypothetical protein